MAVREILKMGNPLLLRRADEVNDFDSEEHRQLITDMFETMAAANGAGLAAPQVGISKRVVIFGVESNPRYPNAESVPTTVLINPEIEILGDEMDSGWEGCLSIPGMRGLVPRYTHIRYRGVNEHGEPIEREARGFHARVVQHECDHLDGVLYPFRIRDVRMFGFEDELFKPEA